MKEIESQATQTNNDVILDHVCNFYARYRFHTAAQCIDALRDIGYRVSVTHLRYTPQDVAQIRTHSSTPDACLKPYPELRAFYEAALKQGGDEKMNYISSHGGRTVVSILEPGCEDEVKGQVTCHTGDPFCKAAGLQGALLQCFFALCDKYQVNRRMVVKKVVDFDYIHQPDGEERPAPTLAHSNPLVTSLVG